MPRLASGMVILFDGRNLEHNNEAILEQGVPMTLTNLVTHVLSNGDQFEWTQMWRLPG